MSRVIVNGQRVDFEAAVGLMDDDIREAVHARLAPCDDQVFVDAYAQEHFAKYGVSFVADSSPATILSQQEHLEALHARLTKCKLCSGVELERARDDYAEAIAEVVGRGLRGDEVAQLLADAGKPQDAPAPREMLAHFAGGEELREVILDAMSTLGMTRTELARRMAELQICNHETVLRYLRYDQDTTGTIIAAMLAELGLVVGPARA